MWMLWSNLVNGLFVCLSIRLQCVCVCVCVSVCVCLSRWSLCFFLWRWEQQSDVKESRESDHILTVSLFQPFSRSCHAVRVAVSLLWLSCLMFPFCLQHDTFPSVSLALSLHVLWYFSPQPQQNLSAFSCSGYCVLFPLPACLCVSPHAYGRLFCVVHWLLFCHYMLQIGGFVFYEDVFTGDWQVKHCNSVLAQRNMQEPLSCPQLPTLTFAPSPTSALMPL